MSDFESILRRALDDRAAGVRTAPDERDVMRRIRRAERATGRKQRAALVAALVVVAGSAGGVIGAVASRPAGVPLLQTADAPSAGKTPATRSGGATSGTPSGKHAASTHPAAMAPAPAPTPAGVHHGSFGGVQVDWLVAPLAGNVEVLPGPGAAAVCSSAAVVSLTLDAGGPVASASGTVGLPALRPDGLAVVSSGAFGSEGRPSGWWAVVEGGSAADSVAVQFPSGAVVRAPLSGGVAVLAEPATAAAVGGFTYGSAVAEGPSRAFGSLEFLFGGGIAAVGAATAGDRRLSACAASPAIAGTMGAAGVDGRPAGGGPAAPLQAAGDVVAAYAQAYDVNPLLGLTWNLAAVDLASPLGCPVESLAVGARTPVDGLAAPAVQLEAVSFVGPASAVVAYRRGAGGLLQTGTAALVGGVWKVGGRAYCADMRTAEAAQGAGTP